MTKSKESLNELIERITTEVKGDIDYIKEALHWGGNSIHGKYTLGYVEGYTGSEGGGENVDFICRVFDGVTDRFFNVGGYYSSWDGTDFHWSQAKEVTPEVTQVVIQRTLYKNERGQVLFTSDEDIVVKEEDSWE
jgi:hypothetical protein